jgi:hypothetical protein
MLRFATIAVTALLAGGSAVWAQTPVERGSYLVNSILT